jgi:uncharacterized protein (TIGR03118 family)
MQRRTTALAVFLGLAMLFGSSVVHAQYQVTNLVSNQPKTARTTDPLLLNAWGLAYGPGGPFWTSDNGSGFSTLYSATGAKIPLNVSIPAASGSGPGSPTGIVFNGVASDFNISGGQSVFIFATLDGTISGWVPSLNPNAAMIAVPSTGAVYTGLAISTNASGNFLFAADAAGDKVDMFDSTFTFKKSFTDSSVPAGFAPYGIQDFNGLLYVTFASTGEAPGGFIDIFAEDGTLLKQLVHGAPLNQAWGLAIAPKNFGPFSNTLLVSNNLPAGTINAFNSVTGQFVGTLKDTNNEVIHINQLWGIEFGGGSGADGQVNSLFFTAGPDNYANGLFGVISFKP